MSKIKSFEASSLQELEVLINSWLREELTTFNHKVNVKNLSHSFNNYENSQNFTALIVYEYG